MLAHGRRRFLQSGAALAGLGLLSACGTAPWTPTRSRPWLGFLSRGALGDTPEYAAFREGLRALGYAPGQTIQLETRWGSPEALGPDLAGLVGTSDVLVAVHNEIVRAAKRATATVPIVMVASADPVRGGLVESLAHPGGNLTGVSPLVPELVSKQLELLKATLPGLRRVGLLWERDDPGEGADPVELRAAARGLGLEPVLVMVSTSGVNIGLQVGAIGELASAGGIEALLVGYDPPPGPRDRIRQMAAERRLPVAYPRRDLVLEGGLLAYGPSFPDLFRRAAYYVDRILKGARPADLPVEQPTTFDFVNNLKTAQALGLTIPQSVLQQATEIIQ